MDPPPFPPTVFKGYQGLSPFGFTLLYADMQGRTGVEQLERASKQQAADGLKQYFLYKCYICWV